jgi:hypothetical protein
MLHTLRWHASVHASMPEEPHTVTHVFGVGSCVQRRGDGRGSRGSGIGWMGQMVVASREGTFEGLRETRRGARWPSRRGGQP